MDHDTVKDLLEEVKNLSELMLDLAYSAVFFKNKEIANEVLLLFEKFEDVEERLYKQLFAASRGQAEQALISVIDVVESAKNVAMAARNLAEMIAEGKVLHPVIHEALEETDETIQRATIAPDSILANKSLKELQLGAEVGISVIGIRRGEEKAGRWIFYPRGSTVLEGKDIVIGIGSNESCSKFFRLATGRLNEL